MAERFSDKVIVLSTDDLEWLSNCSLLLSALNIQHFTAQQDGLSHIFVAEEDAEYARKQIELYLQENKNWPPRQIQDYRLNSSFHPPTYLVIGALLLFYSVTGPWSGESHWFNFGQGDSTKILIEGEYYRLITALTLHADIVHLFGNCLLGGFILHFLCKSSGPGLGLLATLFSATLGNYINVYLRGPGHLFVGFSTAVFAVVGIFVMQTFHQKKRLGGFNLILPFMGGLAILAMTGSSGERTDLGAHLFGLLSGIILGWVITRPFFLRLKQSATLQLIFFVITILLVYYSWDMAMMQVY